MHASKTDLTIVAMSGGVNAGADACDDPDRRS
jgi:hypothetical protein